MRDAYTEQDTLSVPMSTTPETRGPAETASSGPGVVSHGWLAASTSFAAADQRKMGRAMSASLGLHGVVLVLAVLVFALRPPVEQAPPTPRENYELTFVQMEGPGGGGGGGGNQSQEPPAKLEMKAEVPKPQAIDVPKVEVEVPPPPPSLLAPVQTTVTMPIQTSGVLTGLAAAPSLGSGSGGGGGTGRGTGSGPGTGSGLGPGTGGGFGDGAYRPGNGVENPVIIRQVDPKYTPEAMRAKIQGVVELEAVIGENGRIEEVRVHRSLDRAYGLDEEAMRVARLWQFRPARFQGKNVPIVVTIQMEFRLH